MKINKIHFLFFLIIMAFCLAIYFAIFFPIINMYPAYYDLAIDIQNNNYTNLFIPFGYAAIISIINDVEISVRVFQFLSLIFVWLITLYVCVDVNSVNKIKNLKIYNLNFIWIFFWFTFLFFNPYFHLNTIRIIDTSLTTFFIAALYALIIIKFKFSKILLIIGGILLGLLIAIRPNSIILILFFLIFFNKNFILKQQTLIMFTSTFLTYAFFSKFITGEFLFWPNNGPYNLFAGNNLYAFEYLKIEHNAENSLQKANEWCGIKIENPHLVSGVEYFNCTLNYIQNDFLGFVKTTIFKFYNLLFRPNFKLAFETYKVIFQILLVIPAYIWWLSFFLNSSFRKEFSVKWAALFIIIYSSVFIGTNTDPRMALPIDFIYIMSAISFLTKGQSNKIAQNLN